MSPASIENSFVWQGVLVLAAYGLGCLNTGYYLVRLKTGQDIRTLGSGNAGARNVGRILGRPGFITTIAGDLLKGVAAILLVNLVHGSELTRALTAIAVVVGHVWPLQLGFRGGKGAATGCGVYFALDPVAAGILLGVCGLGVLILRRSTLATMIAFGLSPLLAFVLKRPVPEIGAVAAVALVVIFSHRSNLRSGMTGPHGGRPAAATHPEAPTLPAGKR